MKKLLCQKIYGKNLRWIFTGIDIKQELLFNFLNLKIKIIKNFKKKFVISNIYINNINFGEITFIGNNEKLLY